MAKKGLQKMKKEISLNDLFKAMLKKAWLLIIFTVVFATVAYTYSAYFMTPKYTSVTEIYVYNPKAGTNVSQSDLNLSQSLLKTYIRILTGNNVTGEVADSLNELRGTEGYEFLRDSKYTMGTIKSMISASAIDDTEIISVKITSASPEEAYLVNCLLLKELTPETKRIVKAGAVESIYEPTLPASPSSPNISRNTVIGALLGFVIASAIIILLFMLDSAVRDEKDLSDTFNEITILGVIPVIHGNAKTVPYVASTLTTTDKNKKKKAR